MKLANILSLCKVDTKDVNIYLDNNSINKIDIISRDNTITYMDRSILEKIYNDIDNNLKIDNHIITIDIATYRVSHVVRVLVE